MPTNPLPPNPADLNCTQAALEAGAANVKIQSLVPDGSFLPVAVLPQAYKAHVIEVSDPSTWLDAPTRKHGFFEFSDADSFTRYFKEHQSPDSRIFMAVTEDKLHLRGILNFHGINPSWNDHVAGLNFNTTPEWQNLNNFKDHWFTQADFASFLEKSADCFTDPSGANLLELISNLEGKANATVLSAIKLQTGAVKIAYTEEVELKGGSANQAGDMVIPTMLNLSVAPFVGVSPYPLQARLRYRIADRRLVFKYEAVNWHLVVRAIADDVSKNLFTTTGVTPFRE